MRYVSQIGIAMVVILFGASLCFGQSCEWTGKWRVNGANIMDLQQTGNAVTGTHYYTKDNIMSHIVGTASGNKMQVTQVMEGMANSSFILTMSEDCTNFTGYWNGNRISGMPIPTVKDCTTSCDKSKHLVWDQWSKYPDCNCICEDGYGLAEGVGVFCKPCSDICKGKKNNEIPDPAECVGGTCKCICDLANGFQYNEHGVCVNVFEDVLLNALRGKDRDATARALLPYLESDSRQLRLFAITGLRLCYKGTYIEDIPSDITAAMFRSMKNDRDLWNYVWRS